MGYYKSVFVQVEDLYFDGFSPIEIAEMTGLHFDEVISILKEVGELA